MPAEGSTLRVAVLFFASAQDLAGVSHAKLELPAPATLADAEKALREGYPRLASKLQHCRLAVDQEFSGPDRELADGSEIAVIPPVSGG
jgi:molybdopterin converting factor subunit 1